MLNQSVTAIEPYLPPARTLLLIAFFSMPIIGVVDWLTDPHDWVTRTYDAIDGELVETPTKTGVQPSRLGVRLGLTVFTGVVGGLLTGLMTWCGFRMRLSWWRIRHAPPSTAGPTDEIALGAEGQSRPTTHPPQSSLRESP